MNYLKPNLLVLFFTVAIINTSTSSLSAFDQIGRYQMSANINGGIFVLDTATGQCWSKTIGGIWVDEGNPTKPQPKPEEEIIALKLPAEKIELTIKQRRSKTIPGSNDKIRLYLDDITAQQVLVSITDRNGRVILDEVSIREDVVVDFKVNDDVFFMQIKDLTNLLVGGDFATLEIASNKAALEVSAEPAKDQPETSSKPATQTP